MLLGISNTVYGICVESDRDLCVCLLAVHGARQEEVIDHRLTDREWAEEWKHLDNVRISMVPMFNVKHLSVSFINIIKQWEKKATRLAELILVRKMVCR